MSSVRLGRFQNRGEAVALGIAVGLVVGCARPAAPDEVAVSVVDTRGRPVTSAVIETSDGRSEELDSTGRAVLSVVDGPFAGVIRGEGFVDEPVVFGLTDAGTETEVSLWRDDVHWSLHASGDVMVARRYLAPTLGDPLVDPTDPGPGAREIVADIAPHFSAADLAVVNLETVVGELALEQAYPAKTFLLQTPPDALSALDELSVDMVDLANNHVYDWGELGLDTTLSELADAGFPTFGAGPDTASAEAPVYIEVNGVTVAFVGFTTIDGDPVNQRMPVDGDPIPPDLPPELAWQYDDRSWGFDDGFIQIPVQVRRPGSAWRAFAAAERDVPPDSVINAFRSLRGVYPEIQDLAARRGHGGAAAFDFERARASIRRANREADVVIVQIHAGLEYAPVRSGFVKRMTQASVESGADLVIMHHPHVYQGAAYEDGALVLYSLGNFLFDQDFFVTMSSVYLRAVFSEDELVEARLVPIEIVKYRPSPAADALAERTLRGLWERSQPGAGSVIDGESFLVLDEDVDAEDSAVPVYPVLDRHTAILEPDQGEGNDVVELRVRGNKLQALPSEVLVDPRLGLGPGEQPEVYVGRDLFGFGQVDDVRADGRVNQGTHWVIDGPSESIVDTSEGLAVELVRDGFNEEFVSVRTFSRVPLPEHRLYRARDESPKDPEARYAIRLRARASGAGQPQLRLVFYRAFVEGPVAEHVIDVDVGRGWTDELVWIDPAWLVDADGVRVDQVLPYIQLTPPLAGQSVLQVADFQVLELRPANAMPDRPGAWDVVVKDGRGAVELSIPVRRPGVRQP